MGKGLNIGKTGTYIAFSAGTGCLVFIDFVAYLVRKNLGLLSKQEDRQIDDNNFKFVFYVSFNKRENSIGIELIEGLRDLCEKTSKKNF